MENVPIAFLFSFIAGVSTGIGSLTIFFIKDLKYRYLSIFMGFSAGVMIYVSFAELLFSSIHDIGFLYGNAAFFLGSLFIALLDFTIPHEYEEEHRAKNGEGVKGLARTGLLVALGITIHNFPEGLITLFGTIKNLDLGFLLLIAVAMHNIPEGISVSFPIYYATRDRRKAFTWSFLSGLAEPVGGIIGFLILSPFINAFLLSAVLAFVAGIMVFISFDELLPLSLKYGEEHIAIASLFLGMIVIALSLLLLK